MNALCCGNDPIPFGNQQSGTMGFHQEILPIKQQPQKSWQIKESAGVNSIRLEAQNDDYALIFAHLPLSTARAIIGSALVGATDKHEMQLPLLKQPGQSYLFTRKMSKRGRKLTQWIFSPLGYSNDVFWPIQCSDLLGIRFKQSEPFRSLLPKLLTEPCTTIRFVGREIRRW